MNERTNINKNWIRIRLTLTSQQVEWSRNARILWQRRRRLLFAGYERSSTRIGSGSGWHRGRNKSSGAGTPGCVDRGGEDCCSPATSDRQQELDQDQADTDVTTSLVEQERQDMSAEEEKTAVRGTGAHRTRPLTFEGKRFLDALTPFDTSSTSAALVMPSFNLGAKEGEKGRRCRFSHNQRTDLVLFQGKEVCVCLVPQQAMLLSSDEAPTIRISLVTGSAGFVRRARDRCDGRWTIPVIASISRPPSQADLTPRLQL
jgi:hypothetical protein